MVKRVETYQFSKRFKKEYNALPALPNPVGQNDRLGVKYLFFLSHRSQSLNSIHKLTTLYIKRTKGPPFQSSQLNAFNKHFGGCKVQLYFCPF